MKSRVIQFIAAILIIAAFVALMIGFVIKSNSHPHALYWTPYRISEGETLWSIASEYKEYDTRIIVDYIQKFNGIDSNIRAGQEIDVPVFE